MYQRNSPQYGDALALLQSLSNCCTPLVFFDPQHREIYDKLKFGNEGARQKGRAQLRAMTSDYVDACCREAARVLRPGGYLSQWVDTFRLCEAFRGHASPARFNRISWEAPNQGEFSWDP
jgi:site-specific DNA-methyltransferase (adenine-specific)